jgi:hypothetical protein
MIGIAKTKGARCCQYLHILFQIPRWPDYNTPERLPLRISDPDYGGQARCLQVLARIAGGLPWPTKVGGNHCQTFSRSQEFLNHQGVTWALLCRQFTTKPLAIGGGANRTRRYCITSKTQTRTLTKQTLRH